MADNRHTEAPGEETDPAQQAERNGQLNEAQKLILARTRPTEELYDLEVDPNELTNLAESDAYQRTLKEMRSRLDTWMVESNDMGREPESEAMFNSDMDVYLNSLRSRKKDPEHLKVIEANIELMRQWARDGK